MSELGFKSLFVLMKIGYDLRDEFADTFNDDVETAFGPLLDALQIADGTLQIAKNDYQWLSDAAFFDLSDPLPVSQQGCGDTEVRLAA